MLGKIEDLTRQLFYTANEALYGTKAVWQHRYWKVEQDVRTVQSIARDIGKMTKNYINESVLDEKKLGGIVGRMQDYDRALTKLGKSVENMRKDYDLDKFNEDFVDNMVRYANSMVAHSESLISRPSESEN